MTKRHQQKPAEEAASLETTLMSAGLGALAAGVLWDSAPWAIAGATGVLYAGIHRIAEYTCARNATQHKPDGYQPINRQE